MVKHARIIDSSAGRVRLLTRDELDSAWTPSKDQYLTVWEAAQHTVKTVQDLGENAAAKLIQQMGPEMADAIKDLAYRLFDISDKRKEAKEATAYNSLIAVWPDLTVQASKISSEEPKQEQLRL